MASSSSAPPPPTAACGWAALPRDVLWSLFTELGHLDLLSGGDGLTCAAWRRLARDEPALWRRIDLTVPEDDEEEEDEDDAAEDDEDEEEEEGTIFSLFADDEGDGYDDCRIYWQKTPANKKVADDGDLISNDGESDDDFDGDSMLALFSDAPVCPEKNSTPAEDDDDGGGLSDDGDESLHLFDDTDRTTMTRRKHRPSRMMATTRRRRRTVKSSATTSMHGLFDDTDDNDDMLDDELAS
ncbi:unnamed protein product [Urochloa humidicola]